MRTSPHRLALVLALLAYVPAVSGLAQTADTPGAGDMPGTPGAGNMPGTPGAGDASGAAGAPGGGGHGHRGRQGHGGTSPGHAKPAEMKIPAEMWPRLDRGALLCTSLDGLRARAEALRGDDGPQPLPPGCRPIGQATKVTVLDRVPPGAAEVSLDATRETGWTDAWLPDRPPAAGGR